MNLATERTHRKPVVHRFGLLNWRGQSLVTSMSIRVLLIGLALSVLFSLLGMRNVHQQESERIEEHVSSLISTVESTVRVACVTGDSTLASEIGYGLLSNRPIASVRIVAGTKVLADIGNVVGHGFPPDATVIRRAVFSPLDSSKQVCEVSLMVDHDYIHEAASEYAWFVALISMLEILVTSAAVAWVMLVTVVRPIKSFSASLRDSPNQKLTEHHEQANELDHMMAVFNDLLQEQQNMLVLEKALRTKLVFNEKRYRALVESSPNQIIRYDRECRRTYCNPAYYTKPGLETGVALGARPQDLWNFNNLTAAEYESILQKVMSDAKPDHVVLEWFGREGQYLVNDFHLVPEVGENGKINGVLAIGHDITALKMQQRSDRDRSRVFEQIVQGGELPVILDRVVIHVESALPGYRCAIYLLDAISGKLQLASAHWMLDDYRDALQCASQPYDLGSESFWRSFCEQAGEFGTLFAKNECIYDQNRNKIGELVLYQKVDGDPVALNAEFLQQASILAAIAVERKQSEKLIQHQARYDSLTDLPNRRMFLNQLRADIAKAELSGESLALMFIDLDRFKNVNDTLGHEVGDQLLIEAAVRIRRCVCESDLVARLGGDEFVVLVPDASEIDRLAHLAKNIADELSSPFELGMNVAYVSASIGIASFPKDASSPNRLVSCADQAMYAAKDIGRNGYQFYSAELSESANRRLQIEVDLRHALIRGEFELYYQSKVDLVNGRVTGAEALIRWNHPEHGLVAPDKFIPVAEDCGLIVELGAWVLRDACRTAARWNLAGLNRKVAINLSARQFQTKHLFEKVVAILCETSCLPEWIELEITESLLLEEGGEVLETLLSFRDHGISIAIDDFGTGYSALSYLARFPINTLKIDRSFTRYVTDSGYHTEVVKAILSIAQSLGQTVVAEGVESIEQAECLRSLGCDLAQGYLYGKPVQRAKFELSNDVAYFTAAIKEARV